MARGKQHLKRNTGEPLQRRPAQQARVEARRTRKLEEAGMFFPKLRNHAKWVFVLLAILFAGGFVFLGIGSGSNGVGDVLSGWLNRGQSSGTSISKLEKQTAAEPRNAQAWRELATAYQTEQRTDDGVRALERLTALRPKDTAALQELAGQYQRQLQNLSVEASAIQIGTPGADPSGFLPPSTTPFGRAYTDPNALQDPLSAALAAQINSSSDELQLRAGAIQSNLLAVDKKIVALDPTDPTTQFQLARVADSLGDIGTAVAAYRQFLKLSPDDPLAAQVKERLNQLSPPTRAASG